jgi:hypothetical protein
MFFQILVNVHLSAHFSKNPEKSCMFLLSMNEVNIKYWFRNFQKKHFYRFSGRIRTFYRRKTDLYEKKISVALPSAVCRLPRKVWLPTSTLSFQLRDFSFWISDWFGPQSILLIFGLREQIPSGSSHTNFWLLFTFSWNIDQF